MARLSWSVFCAQVSRALRTSIKWSKRPEISHTDVVPQGSSLSLMSVPIIPTTAPSTTVLEDFGPRQPDVSQTAESAPKLEDTHTIKITIKDVLDMLKQSRKSDELWKLHRDEVEATRGQEQLTRLPISEYNTEPEVQDEFPVSTNTIYTHPASASASSSTSSITGSAYHDTFAAGHSPPIEDDELELGRINTGSSSLACSETSDEEPDNRLQMLRVRMAKIRAMDVVKFDPALFGRAKVEQLGRRLEATKIGSTTNENSSQSLSTTKSYQTNTRTSQQNGMFGCFTYTIPKRGTATSGGKKLHPGVFASPEPDATGYGQQFKAKSLFSRKLIPCGRNPGFRGPQPLPPRATAPHVIVSSP